MDCILETGRSRNFKETDIKDFPNIRRVGCFLMLMLFQGIGVMGQQTNMLALAASTNAAPVAIQGIVAEAQWRPGATRTTYPTLEVYLTNQSGGLIDWKRALLDGNEIKFMTNGVVWSQFYPTEKMAKGQTILYQLGLRANPQKLQKLDLEDSLGRTIRIEVPIFRDPPCEIGSMTFSRDFKRAFIGYNTSMYGGLAPQQIWINGKECTASGQLLARSRGLPGAQPGVLAVNLPETLGPGALIHVKLLFDDSSVLETKEVCQSLSRAWNGIFLDAFGFEQEPRDEKRLRQLGLDVNPSSIIIGLDPTCDDLGAGYKYGLFMPPILAARKFLFAKYPTKLSYVYLCTSAAAEAYSIYGRCTDAIQVNPYRLHWSRMPNFIEEEEERFVWGRKTAEPRPWYWIPEVFNLKDRILEPSEYRILACAALANGCKGLRYYLHGGKDGFQNSELLTKTIIAFNAEVRKLEPILATAIPIAMEERKDNLRVYTLWSGDAGMLVVIRQTDYQTDREPNDWGRKPRFHCKPRGETHVEVEIPSWMWVGRKVDPAQKFNVSDPLTGQSVACAVQEEYLKITLPNLELVQFLWVPNPSSKEISK